MYDVGGKLLIGIKSMFVYSLACVGVKCAESELFRIDSGFSLYIWISGEDGDGKEGIEQRLSGLLCADDSEDLKAMMECFVELCRKRGLKVNAGKSRVMILNGEDGLECEVSVDGVRLDCVSEFKYLRCVFDKSGIGEDECNRKVVSERG